MSAIPSFAANDAVWGHFGKITNVLLVAIVSHRTYPSDPQAFARVILSTTRAQIEGELDGYAANPQPPEGEDPAEHAAAFEAYREDVSNALAALERVVIDAVTSLPPEMGGVGETSVTEPTQSSPSTPSTPTSNP